MSTRSNDRGAGTQSIERASQLLRVIASRNGTGLRLVELSRHTRLERPTVHRILKCLVKEGVIKQDAKTHRYFLGHLIFELGLAAGSQFNQRDVCRESLLRLAEGTGDTVFLTMRSGFDTVCLDRKEGSFPIRTLTLDIGTRRPLGAGAGGLALLMSLPEQAVQDIVSANARRLGAYNNLTVPAMLRMWTRSQELGYALNDAHITPDAMSVGMAIPSRYGDPYLAISIGAISSRMTRDRQKELAALMKIEVKILERALNDAASP